MHLIGLPNPHLYRLAYREIRNAFPTVGEWQRKSFHLPFVRMNSILNEQLSLKFGKFSPNWAIFYVKVKKR
jgi:hypothetical protein